MKRVVMVAIIVFALAGTVKAHDTITKEWEEDGVKYSWTEPAHPKAQWILPTIYPTTIEPPSYWRETKDGNINTDAPDGIYYNIQIEPYNPIDELEVRITKLEAELQRVAAFMYMSKGYFNGWEWEAGKCGGLWEISAQETDECLANITITRDVETTHEKTMSWRQPISIKLEEPK